MGTANVHIEMFFDKDSSTFSYVVADTHSRHAAVLTRYWITMPLPAALKPTAQITF